MSEEFNESSGRHALRKETPETAQTIPIRAVDPAKKTHESGKHRAKGFDLMHIVRPLIALGLTLPAAHPDKPTVEGKLIPPPAPETPSSDYIANVPVMAHETPLAESTTAIDAESKDFHIVTGDKIAEHHK